MQIKINFLPYSLLPRALANQNAVEKNFKVKYHISVISPCKK